jgi:hypothetical protein
LNFQIRVVGFKAATDEVADGIVTVGRTVTKAPLFDEREKRPAKFERHLLIVRVRVRFHECVIHTKRLMCQPLISEPKR